MTVGRREFMAGALLASGRAFGAGGGRAVPFRAGRSDLDSGIACARMAMSFFEPREHFPVADLEEMTAHARGHWFFEPQLVPIMLQKKRRVELFSDLDYRAIARGRGLDRFGPEAEKMIDRPALAWALDAGADERTRPALGLEALLEKHRPGTFLMIAADRGALRGVRLPPCRYFVVVTGHAEGKVWLHDPSLGPNREFGRDRVEEAFGREAAGRSALLLG